MANIEQEKSAKMTDIDTISSPSAANWPDPPPDAKGFPIVIAPDPRLKQVAKPVTRFDEKLRDVLDAMVVTMNANDGYGLAAPQIGLLQRMMVIDPATRGAPPTPYHFINPEITWRSPQSETLEEGCLSLPDIYVPVTRAAAVKLTYRDGHNQPHTLEAEGLFARCIQHEIDHLDGILHVDYLSALKRNMILRKLTKLKRLDLV